MARQRGTASAGATQLRPPTEAENPDPEADPTSSAHTICLRLLAVRSRTRAELASALQARNIPDPAAESVLSRLERVKLIDDAAFATDFVASRRVERGLSAREIARQLRTKGVAPDIIEAALAEVDEGAEYETARALGERKLRSMARLDPAVQTRRLAGQLARKGYAPQLVYRVVRELIGTAQLGDAVEAGF
ncbi:MAG TPA: regulatory protein RecX [Jatrophihabitans sp.]|nr:regulatory protein RecX [Jatrophihabitans sp.]